MAIAKQRARIASLQKEIDKAKSAEPETDHYYRVAASQSKALTPQQPPGVSQLANCQSHTAAYMDAVPSQHTQQSRQHPALDDTTMDTQDDGNTQDSSTSFHTQGNQPQSLWL